MATQTRKLQAAFDLLSILCDDVSDTMPIRQARAFVAVAMRATVDGEADLRDIAKDIKANSAVASRDLLVLGKRGRVGRPGFDLIAVREDYTDLRRRPYRLTGKGQSVVNKLLEAV